MTTSSIVLLHGGWGGGWEWRAVADLLAGDGHQVFRPSFTGLGDRRHLASRDIGLETHVDDVVTLLDAEQLGDVVLVGQSYAGMVMSAAAARRPSVRSLVYLDAFVPADGECLLDLVPEALAAGFAQLAANGDGWRVPLPFTASDDDPPEVKAYSERANVPMPLRCFTDPVSIPTRVDIPTTYVRCTQIEGLDAMERSMSRARARDWPVIDIDAPHDAHYFAPEAVATIIAATLS